MYRLNLYSVQFVFLYLSRWSKQVSKQNSIGNKRLPFFFCWTKIKPGSFYLRFFFLSFKFSFQFGFIYLPRWSKPTPKQNSTGYKTAPVFFYVLRTVLFCFVFHFSCTGNLGMPYLWFFFVCVLKRKLWRFRTCFTLAFECHRLRTELLPPASKSWGVFLLTYWIIKDLKRSYWVLGWILPFPFAIKVYRNLSVVSVI